MNNKPIQDDNVPKITSSQLRVNLCIDQCEIWHGTADRPLFRTKFHTDPKTENCNIMAVCFNAIKPNFITLSWSQTGPRLVANLTQTC